MTILHFIGQIFLSWLALTLPATAQTTAQPSFRFHQVQQLEEAASMPFWKESAASVWSLLSESLEESAAENEEEGRDGEPSAAQLQARSAWHQRLASTADVCQKSGKQKLPLYLWHCSLKIHLI